MKKLILLVVLSVGLFANELCLDLATSALKAGKIVDADIANSDKESLRRNLPLLKIRVDSALSYCDDGEIYNALMDYKTKHIPEIQGMLK